MTQAPKKSALPVLAGISFLLVAMAHLFSLLTYAISKLSGDYSFYFISYSMADLLFTLIFPMAVCTVIALGFLTRKTILSGAGFAVLCVLNLYELIGGFLTGNLGISSVRDLFYVLGYFFCILGSILAALCLLGGEKNEGVRKLWILPGALLFMSLFMDMVYGVLITTSLISYDVFSYVEPIRLFEYLANIIDGYLLIPLFLALGSFLGCKWIANGTEAPVSAAERATPVQAPPVWRQPAPQRTWQPPAPQQSQQTPAPRQSQQTPMPWQNPSGAEKPYPRQDPNRARFRGDYGDELIRLKQLMDDGLITQEDYDAKKKQILGI